MPAAAAPGTCATHGNTRGAGRGAQAPSGGGSDSLDRAGSRLPGALLGLLAGGPGGWQGRACLPGLWRPLLVPLLACLACLSCLPSPIVTGCCYSFQVNQFNDSINLHQFLCMCAPPPPQAHLVYEVRELAEIKHFCNHKLGLRWVGWAGRGVGGGAQGGADAAMCAALAAPAPSPASALSCWHHPTHLAPGSCCSERQMGTVTWPEVAQRLVQVSMGGLIARILRELLNTTAVLCGGAGPGGQPHTAPHLLLAHPPHPPTHLPLHTPRPLGCRSSAPTGCACRGT